MSQLDIWVQVAQMAINYIVVSTITTNNQKMTVTDLKTDLRTTKEDLMSAVKITEEQLINQIKESQRKGDNSNG